MNAEPKPKRRRGSPVAALIVATFVFLLVWLPATWVVAMGYAMGSGPVPAGVPIATAFVAAVPAAAVGALVFSLGPRGNPSPRRKDGVPITLDQLRTMNAARGRGAGGTPTPPDPLSE